MAELDYISIIIEQEFSKIQDVKKLGDRLKIKDMLLNIVNEVYWIGYREALKDVSKK